MDRLYLERGRAVALCRTGRAQKRQGRSFFRAYDEVGKEDIRWYLIPYWFERFGIRKDCGEFIAERSHRIELYDDAVEVLKLLKKAAILTNAPSELAEAEMRVIENRAPVKLRLYSAVSDFGTQKEVLCSTEESLREKWNSRT